MRYIFIFFIGISIFSFSYAEESSEISLLISKIKTAKSSEKHLLMNQLKIKLREMNKENQVIAMKELRKSLNSNTTGKNIQHKNQLHGFKQQTQLQKQNKQNQQHNSSQYKNNK